MTTRGPMIFLCESICLDPPTPSRGEWLFVLASIGHSELDIGHCLPCAGGDVHHTHQQNSTLRKLYQLHGPLQVVVQLRPRLFHTVRIFGKAGSFARMNVFVRWPGPSSEMGLPVLIHGLLNFSLTIHYERAVLHHRFVDWLSLK